jgi:hypothetical protein
MTLDKLQLIATAVVPASSEALHFPTKLVFDKELEAWLSKASFYVGVTFYVYSFKFKTIYI